MLNLQGSPVILIFMGNFATEPLFMRVSAGIMIEPTLDRQNVCYKIRSSS